jgi:hypothetical protein
LCKKNGENLPAGTNYAFINNIGASIIKSLQLYISNSLVSELSNSHMYHYVMSTLTSSKECKESLWSLSGGYYQKSENNEKETGYTTRRDICAENREIHVSSKLMLDIFQIPKIFLNFTPIRLVVHLNDTPLLVETLGIANPETSEELKDVMFKVTNVYLSKTEVELTDPLMVSIEKHLLSKRRIAYPMTQSVMRNFFIEKARTEWSCTVFTSRIPKRIIMFMVDSKDYNGNQFKSPYYFGHNNLRNCYIEAGGRVVPARPWNLDIKNHNYGAAYLSMMESMGFTKTDGGNGIDMKAFINGFFFIVFDLSSTLDKSFMEPVKTSHTSVRLEFAQPLDTSVMLTVVGDFDSILSLDENRVPHISSLV